MNEQNWPELWERESSLRPTGISGDRLRVNPDNPANFEWHRSCDSPCLPGGHRRPVWIDDAGALSRDAAVEWLDSGGRRFGGFGSRFISKELGGKGVMEFDCHCRDRDICRSNVPDIFKDEGREESRGAALFRMCKTILDARDEKGANP